MAARCSLRCSAAGCAAPAPRAPPARAPRRRVRIPPSVERREASRLRNLRRRIPFIATRDSINTACDRCGSLAARRPCCGRREALAFPEWENERSF
uniref:Uncharacterized protein n=1 Tax=Heliothis virescens TaxID=7102 RepID=A0A2A4K237_HELVI